MSWLTALRLQLASLVSGLAVLARQYPAAFCLASCVLLAVLLFSVGRGVSARQSVFAAKVTVGPLWLGAALGVAAGAVVLVATDALLASLGVARLEHVLLSWLFEPPADVPVPRGTLFPGGETLAGAAGRLSLPAPLRFVVWLLLGSIAYLALVGMGGAFLLKVVELEEDPDLARERLRAKKEGRPPPPAVGEDSTRALGGFLVFAGHYNRLQVTEERFREWAGPATLALLGMAVVAAPAAMAGHVSSGLFVAALIAAHGMRRVALPPAAPAGEEAKEDEPPLPSPAKVEPEQLERRLAERLGARFSLTARTGPRPAVTGGASLPAAEVFQEVCAALGLALYRHQAEAVEAVLAGRSALLATPAGSGRHAIRDALAMYTVLGRGQSVLFVARDAAGARAAEVAVLDRAREARWRWNVPTLLLPDRAGSLDPSRAQPAIIFADAASVHRHVLERAHRLPYFLATLGLVEVDHLEEYPGVQGDHLALLLARLRRAATTARLPGFAREGEPLLPCFFALAEPVVSGLGLLAERVFGAATTVITESQDGAPSAAQRHGWLEGAGGTLAATDVAETLRELEAPFASYGMEDEWEGRGEAPRGEARVVVARVDRSTRAAIPGLVRHFGGPRPAGEEVLSLWLPGRDPLSRLLASDRGRPAGALLEYPPLCVAGGKNVRVARAHLRCALAESAWPEEVLAATFGAETTAEELHALAAEGRLVAAERVELVSPGGELRRRRVLRARGIEPHADLALDAAGAAVAVKDRNTGAVVLRLARERALAAAYPGRVLQRGGRRYRVLPPGGGGEGEELFAEAESRELWTVPAREFEVTDARRRGERRAAERAGEDRRTTSRHSIGGLPFSFGLVRAHIRERVSGYRRLAQRGVLESATYSAPIEGTHEGDATVLGFPAELGWKASPSARHGLVHLLRTCLPAVIDSGEDDLEVVDVEYAGTPAIAFIDLHPGGAGFARAVDIDALRSLMLLSQAVLRGCTCGDEAGCPRCVRIVDCRSPLESAEERRPSRREAEALLEAIVGTSARDVGPT